MIRARFPLMMAAAGTLALSACTDPSRQTDERNRSREGALIGGAIGAVLGGVKEDDRRLKNAVIGGVIGAGVGALIGDQLDSQAAELRRDIGDERIGIVNTGSELIVTMPQDILFEVDSTHLRPDLRDDLRVVAANLQDYPDTTADVIGHADNTGSASYNRDLSARRADAVAGILLGSGVGGHRVRAYGLGESEPVASNLTPEGRARNRRVEIVIRPISG